MTKADAISAVMLQMEPPPTTIEVTVFSRRSGECVVVHTGGGKWLVVDSFASTVRTRRPRRQNPIAIRYLRDCLGLDVTTCVTAVALTHFHADHYGAFYELVLGCSSAEVTFTPALDAHVLTRLARIVPGLASVKDAYVYASDRGRLRFDGQVHWAHAIAPAAAAQSRANRSLVKLLDSGAVDEVRALADQQNYTSLVLYLDINGVRILLGGDLDDDEPNMGWGAAQMAFEREGPGYPRGPASFLKVPHHGSARAHNLGVLAALTDRPLAVISARPGNDLPDATTLQSLRSELGATVHVSHQHPLPPMDGVGVRHGEMHDKKAFSIRMIRSRWNVEVGRWAVDRSDDFESIAPGVRSEGPTDVAG